MSATITGDTARGSYLEAAESIAKRLASSAIWSGEECTWLVGVPEPTRIWERNRVELPAGPFVYAGTAGIALFLIEAHRLTGGDHLLHAARGAVAHALRSLQETDWSACGFYAGRVGVSAAALRLHQVSGDEWALAGARSAIAPIFGRERECMVSDVIGGAAGAVPTLLKLSRDLDWDAPAESAVLLGEHIIRTAQRGPVGWSWRGGVVHQKRDLAGLAHGAAGYGFGLLELAIATGDSAFEYAANQAFSYEAHVFDAQHRNWPDFRNSRLGEMITNPETRRELEAATRRGEAPPPWIDSSMVAWCHGAAGVALSRLRAYELTGKPGRAAEARIAVETTLKRMPTDGRSSFALCHGVFGNAETLLEGARVLTEPSWAANAHQLAQEGIARFESAGVSWPSGGLHGAPDPTLLLGDAGIGYFLLRIADPSVPSILLPTGPGARSAHLSRVSDEASLALRAEASAAGDVRLYFRRAAAALHHLVPEAERLDGDGPVESESTHPPVLAAYDRLRGAAGGGSIAQAAALADAIGPEVARFELALSLTDHVPESLERMFSGNTKEIDWNTVRVTPHCQTVIVSSGNVWDRAAEGESIDEGQQYVVFQRDNTAHLQRIGPLPAGLITESQSPATLDELTDRIVGRLGIQVETRAAWQRVRASVETQVRLAINARILRVCGAARLPGRPS
jgi:hypothetical protein